MVVDFFLRNSGLFELLHRFELLKNIVKTQDSNMACNSKALSLFEEKKLSETVQNFPVLYDRSKKGFKERDAVKNAFNHTLKILHGEYVCEFKFQR